MTQIDRYLQPPPSFFRRIADAFRNFVDPIPPRPVITAEQLERDEAVERQSRAVEHRVTTSVPDLTKMIEEHNERMRQMTNHILAGGHDFDEIPAETQLETKSQNENALDLIGEAQGFPYVPTVLGETKPQPEQTMTVTGTPIDNATGYIWYGFSKRPVWRGTGIVNQILTDNGLAGEQWAIDHPEEWAKLNGGEGLKAKPQPAPPVMDLDCKRRIKLE